MSRQLPEKPNLAHLKKQAKETQRSLPQGKLAEAQHMLAQEYGFASWAKLKRHVESLERSPAASLQAAVCDSDAAEVRRLLAGFPGLRATINDALPNDGFGLTALYAAVQRSDRDTIDVLLQAGADIGQRTHWWAGGFGVLDECDSGLVSFLVERGAVIDAHSAARLGLLAALTELVRAEPALVHARGGDGQTPLHFASTVEVAAFLLEHGADMDSRDIDHESTPAQHMLRVEHWRHYARDRQDVARSLVARGCQTDLLMAAALGDKELVQRHLEREPNSIRMSVSEKWFPKKNPRSGGTIYIWKLGANRTAHTVAREFGHEGVFQLLMEHTPEELKLSLACELGDEAALQHFLAQRPNRGLPEPEQARLPNAAQGNNTQAVRLMLRAGWPVNAAGEMGATALHWAGFHGNAEMANAILAFHPTLELKSREYAGSALSWAIFGSGNGWHRDTGDYVGTVRALLDAGSAIPPQAEELEPSDAVLELLP